MDKCFAGESDRNVDDTNGISDTQYNMAAKIVVKMRMRE